MKAGLSLLILHFFFISSFSQTGILAASLMNTPAGSQNSYSGIAYQPTSTTYNYNWEQGNVQEVTDLTAVGQVFEYFDNRSLYFTNIERMNWIVASGITTNDISLV